MLEEEDFQSVIKRRKDHLPEQLLKSCVCEALESGALCKVCDELNAASCLDRNWRGVAVRLIKPSPDKSTIERLSNCNDPAYEMLSSWGMTNEEGFDLLLEVMVDSQTYSAADELLVYLESVDGNETLGRTGAKKCLQNEPEIICEAIKPSVEERNESQSVKIKHVNSNYKRSKSSMGRKIKNVGRLFRRSTSCPETDPNHPIYQSTSLHSKKDEIFIVSSYQDKESTPVKKLVSFVESLKQVKVGEWHVTTIHDIQGGPMTPTWLRDRVERAVYVIICFSNYMRQISDHQKEDGELFHQAEYNLKFTLDFLINGSLYQNLCYNVGGKFLPVLLPGNPFSCIMQSLANFQVFSWPNDQKKIYKYLMNLPERNMPPLGEKKPLVSKPLN